MMLSQKELKTVIIKIIHHTKYQYSDAVFLEPHTLKFTPHSDFSNQVLQSGLQIKPEPSGVTQSQDHNGNLAYMVWFNELTSSLEVYSEVVVRLIEFNPYAFIIYPSYGMKLPMTYPQNIKSELNFMLDAKDVNPILKEYANNLAAESKNQTVDFLSNLTTQINQDFKYKRREYGQALSPEQTFMQKIGSCRDMVEFAREICKVVGIATRFVSGYFIDEELSEAPELHAWFEAYIPGAGWRGFDPTHGIACYGRHVALASAYDPVFTATVTGSYRGQAQSTMSTHLQYSLVEA